MSKSNEEKDIGIDESSNIEDRGVINDGRTEENNSAKGKLAVGAAIAVFAGYLLWTTLSPDKESNEVQVPRNGAIGQSSGLVPAQPPAPTPLELAPPPPLPPVTLPTPTQNETTQAEEEEVDPLLDAARRAPVLAFSGQSSQISNKSNDSFIEAPEARNENSQKFSGLLKPTPVDKTGASHIGNRNYIIAMGTSIPCILETALNSDQPGFTSCIVTRDILSDNGRVVLLDKGTQVVGEYTGGLQKGQSRLFVLWTRAKTPDGVIITLASPATDSLGRAGFDGKVNTHWWQRFGSALLLSVVGDGMKVLADQANNNNNNIQLNDTTRAGKEAASIALEYQIDIPATLEKNQGELVNIFVARDLDFSSVYRLKVTEGKNKIYDRAVLGDFTPSSPIPTK